MAGAARSEHALPVSKEAGESVLLDGLDFFAETGEGFASNLAKDFGVAPFRATPQTKTCLRGPRMHTAGAEAAFEDSAFNGEGFERGFDGGGIEAEALGGLAQGEWAVSARVAADELKDRLGDGLEKCDGETGRKRNAEGVAITGGVFGGDETLLSTDA